MNKPGRHPVRPVLLTILFILATGCAAQKELQQAVDAYRIDVEGLQNRIAELERELESARSENRVISVERDQLAETCESLSSLITSLEAEKARLEADLLQAEADSTGLAERIAELEGTILTYRSRLTARQNRIAELEAELRNRQATIDRLNNTTSSLREEIGDLQEEQETLQVQMEESVRAKNRTINLLLAVLGVMVIVAAIGYVLFFKDHRTRTDG